MKTSDLFGFFLRSLLMMSSLNFQRMQNLGFAYAILPLARGREGDRRKVTAFLLKHLEYFNTHPYMSGAVLGATIRLEEDKDSAGSSGPAATTELKQALMGPYAAIGDSFFWGSLRPLAGIIAGIIAYGGSVWAPFAFLLIFNPLHLWIRWKGFLEGYRQGRQGIAYIQSWNLPRLARCLRWISLILLGVITGLLAVKMRLFPGQFWLWQGMNIAVPAAALLVYFAVRRGLSPLAILYALTAVCVALTI